MVAVRHFEFVGEGHGITHKSPLIGLTHIKVQHNRHSSVDVVCLTFYRATHMHSADYAVTRCPFVCPSVCHTPVLSLNGYTYPQCFLTIE